MAEENTVVEEIVAAAPKRKAAAKKPGAKRKPAAAKKPVAKTSALSASEIAERAQQAGRKAFLASLGFYGKAFDQAQEQFQNLQDLLEERRAKANKLYAELVARGEKIEKDAREAFEEFELPTLESLTDRSKLEAQLEKAKARFKELKESVNFKAAA